VPDRVKKGCPPLVQQGKSIDRPLLGVLLTICFGMIIPFSDVFAKILMGSVPLVTILLARFTGQALMSAPALLRNGMKMSGRLWMLTGFRTALQLYSLGLIYIAFRYIPLADAIAIGFISPFLLMLMGKFFLGEQVGPRRISACGVGFIGTMMVIQPSFSEVGVVALIPLASAFTFALYSLTTRQLVREGDPALIQGISGVQGAAMMVLVALVAGSSFEDARIVVPSVDEAWLLFGIAFVGSFAHMLMTWALRLAPAATLAPVQYAEIPFATLMGWLFFAEFPNDVAAMGMMLIVGAGLYIVYRERVVARQKAVEAAQGAQPVQVTPPDPQAATTPAG